MRRWQHSSMKCAALSALSEKRMPLLARMPTGMPWMCAKPVTSVVAVERLELVEIGSVDQPRDHLAHVVLLLEVGGTMPSSSAASYFGSRGLASATSRAGRVLRLATMRRQIVSAWWSFSAQ